MADTARSVTRGTSPTSLINIQLPNTSDNPRPDATDVSIRAAKRRRLYGLLSGPSTSSPSRPSVAGDRLMSPPSESTLGGPLFANAERTTLAVLAEQLGTGQRDGDTDSSSGDSAGETDQGDMDGTDGYEEEGDAEGDQDVLQPFQMDIIHEYYAHTGMTDEQKCALIAQATAASKMPRAVWEKLQTLPGQSFAPGTFPSGYLLRRALSQEAKLDLKFVDCCINGCRAFTRSFQKDTVCFSCLQARFTSDGRPRQRFMYLSPINRLRAQHTNKEMCARLNYPFVRTVEKGKYQDIWEGAHIKRLRKRNVEWAGQEVPGAGRYFEDDTHIALGLAMDGLPCFKRSKLDCWPILLTNYSLPPEVRTKREFQICCGLIPGTREQTLERKVDMDSFLWPLIEDLERLATTGVSAKRWVDNKLADFTMRGHLVIISGDMPAIAKMMNFKNIGAMIPCRWCKMPARRAGDMGNQYGKYYLANLAPESTDHIDYGNLPLRTHAEVLKDVHDIRNCRTVAEKEEKQKSTGINDQSVFLVVGSISFPWSFSPDIMHILFENIMKELLGLWEGTYKAAMVTGDETARLGDRIGETYVIPKSGWDAMDNEIAASNATIPARLMRRLGSITKRGFWTAETYSNLLSHLGPIILKGRLQEPYYSHFCKLSALSNILSQLEIKVEDVYIVRAGLIDWVAEFERLYYRYDDRYLPFCTNPIHSLLHIAKSIVELGPPCHYWCFSMERFGGWIKRQVGLNRKRPIETLNNRMLVEEQIHQLISTLRHPDQIVPRRDSVTGFNDKWSENANDLPGEKANEPSGNLFEKGRSIGAIPTDILQALGAFFSAREWTPEAQQTKTVKKYKTTEVMFNCTNVTSYKGYRTSKDRGAQCWRTQKSRKENERRDTSWVFYRVFEDEKARCFRGEADWVMRPMFGEIKQLLSFNWKKQEEELWVAVIQGWCTENWFDNMPSGEVPQRLIRQREWVDVVEVSALEAMAGRIRIKAEGGDREVVFETSSGCLKAEMF